MSNLKDTDGIEQQYTEHPYPDPIFDMSDRIQSGYRQGSCPEEQWYKLFPEKTYRDDLNVLIAGCGTNQAVYHALKFPNSHHYAIDVSDMSLNHVRSMIKNYGIKNLEIEKKDIVDLTHEGEFDYVISTGVIHHTKDPQKSLSKLVETTKDDGALFIMVYAIYLRVGVYFMQDAFRYLDLKPTTKDIGIAKRLINLSLQNHYVHNYIKEAENSTGTKDLTFDAGFVDTFFNARDVAYDIFQLKELIGNAGAYFQSWGDNSAFYRKVFNFSAAKNLNQAFDNLGPWELADFTQKVWPNMGKFSFSLRKDKQYEHRFFNIAEILPSTYAYRYRLTDVEKPNLSSRDGGSIGIHRLKVKLDIRERIIWDNLNNKIEDVLNASNKLFSEHGIDTELSFEELQVMLHQFWKNGYLSFSDK